MTKEELLAALKAEHGIDCTPVGGRKWLYEQAREKYIRTGDGQALVDMLLFVDD